MSKRCSPCNKSKHYQCHQGSCPCKCQLFEDTIRSTAEPERLSDPKNDEFADDINQRFRELST